MTTTNSQRPLLCLMFPLYPFVVVVVVIVVCSRHGGSTLPHGEVWRLRDHALPRELSQRHGHHGGDVHRGW